MTNPFRSEIVVTIDGVEYKVRPTFNLIAEIEHEVAPILPLVGRLRAGQFKLSEVAKILLIAVRGCENKPKDGEAFLNRLMAIGILNHLKDAIAILMNALNTGEEPKNEERGNTGS